MNLVARFLLFFCAFLSFLNAGNEDKRLKSEDSTLAVVQGKTPPSLVHFCQRRLVQTYQKELHAKPLCNTTLTQNFKILPSELQFPLIDILLRNAFTHQKYDVVNYLYKTLLEEDKDFLVLGNALVKYAKRLSKDNTAPFTTLLRKIKMGISQADYKRLSFLLLMNYSEKVLEEPYKESIIHLLQKNINDENYISFFNNYLRIFIFPHHFINHNPFYIAALGLNSKVFDDLVAFGFDPSKVYDYNGSSTTILDYAQALQVIAQGDDTTTDGADMKRYYSDVVAFLEEKGVKRAVGLLN